MYFSSFTKHRSEAVSDDGVIQITVLKPLINFIHNHAIGLQVLPVFLFRIFNRTVSPIRQQNPVCCEANHQIELFLVPA